MYNNDDVERRGEAYKFLMGTNENDQDIDIKLDYAD